MGAHLEAHSTVSKQVLDPFLDDSIKVFIDGMVCFVHTRMNEFNMYLLNRFENLSYRDNLSWRITSGI
jgi:hypothetical protein